MSDSEKPTEPLPESLPPTEPYAAPTEPFGAPVAAHVPIADAGTAPYETAPAGQGPSRTWLWVIIATLTIAVIVAVVAGLTLAQQDRPLPGVTGTPSTTPTSAPSPVEEQPAPEQPAPEPTEPAPEPTQPPEPEPTEPAPTPTP